MVNKKLRKCIPGDDWEIKEIIHKHNGMIESEYYYKGVPAIKIPLEGNVPIKMAGYTLLKQDLELILYWLQMVTDEHKKMGLNKVKQTVVHITPKELRENIYYIKAMMVASFSFYGKLFTRADGRKIKLEENVFNNSMELLQIHKEVMSLRHNFVAHSGKERIEYVEVSLLLDSIRERNTLPLIARVMNQPNVFTNKFLDNFKYICNYLLEKVDSKIELLTQKYYSNLTHERINMFYEIAKT